MSKTPLISRTVEDIRAHVSAWRAEGKRVALVPTMGALHVGHLSLIDKAREVADHVVVSIFVNPTQFGEGEDFDDYPRTWQSDLEALTGKNVEAIFAPTAKVMYPTNHATSLSITGPALELETTYRPHFFTGVATIVSKLLLGTLADVAVFGEKDYQQLLVVKQMVQDLHIPCEIIGATIVREADGLALSSRNAYLSDEERPLAAELYKVLQQCATEIRATQEDAAALSKAVKDLTKIGFQVDYVALRHAETLKEVKNISEEPLRLLAAARLGKPRLIDNIAV